MFTINFKREFKRCCCYFKTEFRDDMNSHTGLIRQNTILRSHSSMRESFHYATGTQNGKARCKRQLDFDPVPLISPPVAKQASSRVTLERKNTPPHIAEGKGLKGYEDDVMMMMI